LFLGCLDGEDYSEKASLATLNTLLRAVMNEGIRLWSNWFHNAISPVELATPFADLGSS